MEYNGIDNLEVMAEAKNYNKYLIDVLKEEINDEKDILDFGAGTGLYAEMLRDRKKVSQCFEIDPTLKAKLSSMGFKVFSSQEELKENSFDFIYSFNVLEHIENDQAELKKLHQKLKPNKKILIYVPAFQLLYSAMDKKVGHFRRYSKQELENKIQAAGFTLDFCSYVDSLGFFASLLFKFIGSKDGSINRKSVIIYDRFIFPLSLVCDYLFKKILGKNILLVAHKK